MNRTQKFALNSLATAVSQIVVMISGLITPRLMIATYGSEVNGLVSSLNQFISYIALVEAGIGGAAVFSLYKPLAENNHGHIGRIVSAANKSYRQAGYLFSSGIFLLALIYGLVCSTETVRFEFIFPLALILGINGCLDFFLVAGKRALLTADQRTYINSAVGMLQTVLRTGLIILLALRKTNVVLLYAIATVPMLLKVLLIALYCRKKYPYLDSKAKPDREALNKRWDVIYQQILGTIQMGAPTIIATILLDFLQVSVYSVYNMVMTGINGVLSIFISGLPAGFGELIAKDERDILKKTVSEFEVAYYYILSVVYGVTMAMILPFVDVYTQGVTDVDYFHPVLAVVIVLNGLLYNIKTPQSMLIISAGMYKETRMRVTIQGIVIIVCSIILGIPFGLVGIMLGSCISNLYRTVDLLTFTPKYITQISPWQSVRRMVIVLVNVVAVSLPALFIEICAMNYLTWALYAVGFGIYALIVVTATTALWDREGLMSLILRAKNIVNKN